MFFSNVGENLSDADDTSTEEDDLLSRFISLS